MRRHKGTTKCPKQKTTQAQKTPTTPTAATTATSTGALHPLCGGAPVMWRCTRTEEVHCLRIGCSAPTYKNKRGTGTPNHSPPHPSMRSWALLVAGRARRPRHHLHPGPLRHLPHPYMRRAGLRAILRVSARNSGFACERHTRPGIVVTTTQTTSPTTPQCQRFSSRWDALWVSRHPELRPHRQQTGGIAALEPRHAGDTPTGGS